MILKGAPALAAIGLLLAACGGSAAPAPSAAAGAAAAQAPTASAASSAGPLQPSAGQPARTPLPPSVEAPASASTAPAASPSPPLARSVAAGPSPVGSSPAAAPAAPVSPSQPQPSSAGGTSALEPALTITNADDGKTFQVRVGQVVDVALKAEAGMDNWQVANPAASILAPTVNPAAAAAQGVTLRAFKAVGAGTATIEATDRPTCGPGQACPHFVRAFRATVVVAA
jgi:hypothetical protein